MKGNQYAKGNKHTEEWKKAASVRHKGNKYNLGRIPWNKGMHIDFCKHGHEQVDDNVYTYPSGKRKCRVCDKLSMRRERAKDRR